MSITYDEMIITGSVEGISPRVRYQDIWEKLGFPTDIAVGIEKKFHCLFEFYDLNMNLETKNDQLFVSNINIKLFSVGKNSLIFNKIVKIFNGDLILNGELKAGSKINDVIEFLSKRNVVFNIIEDKLSEWPTKLTLSNGIVISFCEVRTEMRMSMIELF